MKERRSLKPGTGIATILLIFVVLAMSILAVLSALKSIQNHQSVERQVEYTQAYSQADAQASKIQAEVRKGNTEEVTPNEAGYEYEINFFEGQSLYVQLDRQGNALVWKTISKTEE